PPGDAHALVVAARIEARGHQVLGWDCARLPSTDCLSIQLSSGGATRRAILESSAAGTVDLAEARSIWWRRPSNHTIPGAVTNGYMRGYCKGETGQLFRGMLSGLEV